MLIIGKRRFGWLTGPRVLRAGSVLSGIVGAIFSVHAHAAVIEYFNPDLNNYFITADPVEQDFVDTGPSANGCAPETFTATAPAVYLAGSKGVGGTEAAGTVSADGLTIEGSDTNQNVSMTWRFLAD